MTGGVNRLPPFGLIDFSVGAGACGGGAGMAGGAAVSVTVFVTVFRCRRFFTVRRR